MVKIREQDVDKRDYSQYQNYKYFHSFPNMVYHADSLSVGDICVIHDEKGRTVSLFEVSSEGLRLSASLAFKPRAQSPYPIPKDYALTLSIQRAIYG